MIIGKNNRETTPPHQRERMANATENNRETKPPHHTRERERERERERGSHRNRRTFYVDGKNRHQNHKALDRNMKILGNTISNVVHEMNPTAPLLLVSSLA